MALGKFKIAVKDFEAVSWANKFNIKWHMLYSQFSAIFLFYGVLVFGISQEKEEGSQLPHYGPLFASKFSQYFQDAAEGGVPSVFHFPQWTFVLLVLLLLSYWPVSLLAKNYKSCKLSLIRVFCPQSVTILILWLVCQFQCTEVERDLALSVQHYGRQKCYLGNITHVFWVGLEN